MKKIIIDCDPGHDDAIAILLAAGNPEIDLLGITTVAGNQTLEKITRNAQSVCAVAGINVPIAKGSSVPLVQKQVVAGDIHGTTGLDGPFLPEPTFDLDSRHAVDFIIDTVMSHEPNTVNLVPIGPLTNIALAMRKEPQIISRVESVIVMGGAYTRGNVSPVAEFNIYVDPEAADAVFSADWPVTMVGLDLTHQALARKELQDRVAAIGVDISTFVLDVWEFVGSTYREVYEFDYPPIHDACCVAALINPNVFTTARAEVKVELRGEYTRGMTVTNFESEPGMNHSNVVDPETTRFTTDVAMELDWNMFADQIVDSIANLTAQLPPKTD